MTVFTHLGIAKAVHRAAERELSVKLDTAGFLYGNIKPDICPGLIRIPHFKDCSFSFICKKIQALMEQIETDSSVIGTRKFSEDLGIISHYLSDYFCYAHSKHFNGGLLSHYLYEFDLFAYCRINPGKIHKCIYSDCVYISNDFNSLCSYIESLSEEYMGKAPCYELDMSYAVKASASICLSILAPCAFKEIILAA